MTYLVTAVLGVLLVGASVIGIVTASNHSQRATDPLQGRSGVVLYGTR